MKYYVASEVIIWAAGDGGSLFITSKFIEVAEESQAARLVMRLEW